MQVITMSALICKYVAYSYSNRYKTEAALIRSCFFYSVYSLCTIILFAVGETNEHLNSELKNKCRPIILVTRLNKGIQGKFHNHELIFRNQVNQCLQFHFFNFKKNFGIKILKIFIGFKRKEFKGTLI